MAEQFDAFLTESAELQEAARADLVERAGEQQALTESAKSRDEAVSTFEETLAELKLPKGKVVKEGDLGGGVKSFSYKAKLNDKQATALERELMSKRLFISNMQTIGLVLVSYLAK